MRYAALYLSGHIWAHGEQPKSAARTSRPRAIANIAFFENSDARNLFTLLLAVVMLVFGLAWYAAHRSAFYNVARQKREFLAMASRDARREAPTVTWKDR